MIASSPGYAVIVSGEIGTMLDDTIEPVKIWPLSICDCCRIWPALFDDPLPRAGAAAIIIVGRPDRPSSSVRPDQTS
jgi:hypothetical protein